MPEAASTCSCNIGRSMPLHAMAHTQKGAVQCHNRHVCCATNLQAASACIFGGTPTLA